MTYYDWLGVLSVVMLTMFIAIGWWAYSPKNKTRFDDAANSILENDPVDKANGDKQMFNDSLPTFWSIWVALITLLVIFGCLWLVTTGSRKV